MGYCPRCGEHSPYREESNDRSIDPPAIRIPIGSSIVPLPADLSDGTTIQLGGCHFSVRIRG
ncbi:MAG: hypothetical protein NZL87_08065, partial [Thermomicrobium sp.]|nr:hypothetical protein [Thermomicrobium sp.]